MNIPKQRLLTASVLGLALFASSCGADQGAVDTTSPASDTTAGTDGGADTTARLLAPKLQEALGESVAAPPTREQRSNLEDLLKKFPLSADIAKCLGDMRLLDGPADQIRVFAQAPEFDARTREALTKVLQLQASVGEAQRKVTEIDNQRKAIVDEQARLRENLARVPANSDLQRRYLATLDKQETELEAIAARRVEAEKAVEVARTALRNFVSSLG